jgi:Protein of unknown function (DUF2878)
MRRRLVNFAGFQIAWIASVWGESSGRSSIGATIVVLVLAAHLLLARRPAAEIRLLAMVGALGCTIDSALGHAALLVFRSGDWLCPLWLVLLWLAFATTLGSSLAWLKDRPVAAAMAGAIFGPLSYYAGQRVGALSLGANPIVTMGVLTVLWAALLPFLLKVVPEERLS